MREGQKREAARTLRHRQTDVERLMWYLLRDRRFAGVKFRRQVPIGPFVVDFAAAAPRLVVELDGGQHVDHAGDKARDAYLAAQGWRVLRFWNNDVVSNRQGVLEMVNTAIEATAQNRCELRAVAVPSPGIAQERSADLSRLRER